SSYSISCGLAFGAAISFTPFIGLHLALSMGLTWLFRGNVVAAAIGTLVGNPWTFPFIWVAIYETGLLLLGEGGHQNITEVLSNFNLLDDPYGSIKPVFLPLLLGSIPYVIISWAAVYFSAKEFIEIRQTRRANKRAKQAHPLRRQDHDQKA
ncbi:MAG TPA: DUF2062 domain-containing protein, partial [Sphingomonadales bacterium]|nr:DUF2062 domain-containing protein [Sphingomonadales bacterium]